MKIYITGMPGCGKSTFGKRVADLLNMPFFDLDKEIIKKENCSINELFEQKGEEYFRNIESEKLKELTTLNNSFILATGGGTPCFNDNIDFMNRQGITIYIRATIPDLLLRLSDKGINKRPLLKHTSREELEQKLSQQMEKRKIYYEKCRFHVAYHETMENDLIKIIQPFTASE